MGALAANTVLYRALADPSARFFRFAAAGTVLTAIAFEICVAFNLGGIRITVALDDIGSGLAALLAGVACAVAAYRTRGPLRLGWTLLAISALSWSAGETYWSYVEVGLGLSVPSPSPADVGYLLSVPFAFAGILVITV